MTVLLLKVDSVREELFQVQVKMGVCQERIRTLANKVGPWTPEEAAEHEKTMARLERLDSQATRLYRVVNDWEKAHSDPMFR